MKFVYRWSDIGSPTEPGSYEVDEFDVRVTEADLSRLSPILARDPRVEFIEATHLQSKRRELIVGLALPD